MSLRFLLDTNIVSEPVRRDPRRNVVARIARHGHESAIAAPTWHELIYGVERLPKGRRREVLGAYLHDVVAPSFPILDYDEPAAQRHGRERARLEGSGRTPPFVDGQIAAIAHVNGLVLITANPSDFSWFEDLSVENWAG